MRNIYIDIQVSPDISEIIVHQKKASFTDTSNA